MWLVKITNSSGTIGDQYVILDGRTNKLVSRGGLPPTMKSRSQHVIISFHFKHNFSSTTNYAYVYEKLYGKIPKSAIFTNYLQGVQEKVCFWLKIFRMLSLVTKSGQLIAVDFTNLFQEIKRHKEGSRLKTNIFLENPVHDNLRY